MDNLKQINDSLGHLTGDQALISIAATCRHELRETDIAYRYGGDEFVIVLPNTSCHQAVLFAERLHQAFQPQANTANSGEHGASEAAKVTVSIGVTEFISDDKTYEDTLRRADNVLYEAKGQGKNCVVIA